MKKISFLVALILFISIGISAHTPGQRITLPMLSVNDKAIENTLIEISDYIRSKPQGLRFPITKIMFSQVKGGLSYQVIGIDNSWANLFNYGEAPYGYVIVANRMYVIMSLVEEKLDLNHIFSVACGVSKAFNKSVLPPTGITKSPKWDYDYADGEVIKIAESDLDILEK